MDVLWITGQHCRLLSIGAIRRPGGEFVGSGAKESEHAFRKNMPMIVLAKKKGLLTLPASVQGNDNYAASAHAFHKQETASNLKK